MRKNTKTEKSKNLHLGLYFGLFVAFIIIVSFTFKVFDTFKKSKFDGSNFFTVAVISDKNAQLISVSPKDDKLKKLTITDTKTEDGLKDLGIPFDNVATSKENYTGSPKSYFTKILFHKDGFKSNLTIFDLIRLSLYTQKIGGDKVDEQSVSSSDGALLSQITSEWFNDPEIIKEEVEIEITNTTETSGLGSKLAKVITNLGGNVVLVNNSQDEEKKSRIYYKEDSYTVKRLSKMLGIPTEKKEMNSISDIVIKIGKDKESY